MVQRGLAPLEKVKNQSDHFPHSRKKSHSLHTQLSTVNHRHPFSDFPKGEGVAVHRLRFMRLNFDILMEIGVNKSLQPSDYQSENLHICPCQL